MKKQSLLKRRVLFGLAVVVMLVSTGRAAFCQTVPGDIDGNGSVGIVDALTLARHLTGLSVPVFMAANADADMNGIIDIVDALVIAQYAAGVWNTLPPYPVTTPTPTFLPVPTHLANAFADAKWYVNQQWADLARADGGAAIADCNTAVWLDEIADIDPPGGFGLADHLDACLTQGADLMTIVLYNLPDRDCTVYPASELECDPAATGLTRYKTEFIDPVTEILKNPKYYGIRIVTIIEPDTLPSLATYVTLYQRCSEVNARGCYVQGIQYVLNKLAPLPNVYKYLGIAHSAWLGWDSNFTRAISLYIDVIRNTTAGFGSIDGFISNVGSYIPTEEIFLPDPGLAVGGEMIKTASFYEYNAMLDELDFCNAWYEHMIAYFPGLGMLIDTSRNGWGGPNRPTRVSAATDVNTYVDEMRLDRRFHRGNWCNNKYAGIGARPTAAPYPHIDAFVWITPPGISDGISEPFFSNPLTPYRVFYTMCDPNGLNTYCNCGTTDARSFMPHRGRWSTDFFQQLLTNAYPPVL